MIYVIGMDDNPNPHDASRGGMDSVGPGLESKPMDNMLPGVGVPNKTFEIKEAHMKKIKDAQKVTKLSNPYPTLSKVLAEEGAEEVMEEGAEPVHPGSGNDEAEKQANMQKLDIEGPEQFGTKFKGQIQDMAVEHEIGELMGYSFRTHKIEIIGSEGVLLLDYDLKPLYVRELYPF